MDSKLTITLYTMSWGVYWDKFGKFWSERVNNFTTQPDEIIIVSDAKVDISALKHSNVKNIIVPIDKPFYPIGHYRNVAIENSSSDWIVASDLDDEELPNYLDNFDPSSDICAFSFIDVKYDRLYAANEDSLYKRLLGIWDDSLIASVSAIKKSVFDKIKYEISGYEDKVFYAKASKLDLKIVNVNPTEPRLMYAGFHPTPSNLEIIRITNIYTKVLLGNRNIYCFWFSKEFTEDIKNAYNSLCQYSGCNVVLVTPELFYSYENIEMPIHEGFQYLNDEHKINYARAYMMYFYGEGYTNIKTNDFDWSVHFDTLFMSKYDVISTEVEQSYSYLTVLEDYYKLVEIGHFIFKPKTKLAYKWLELIHEQMDSKIELKEN